MNEEILRMQIRLFRLACRRWNKSNIECAEIFDRYGIDEYIAEFYDLFHIQGDEADIQDIESYLVNRGASDDIR